MAIVWMGDGEVDIGNKSGLKVVMWECCIEDKKISLLQDNVIVKKPTLPNVILTLSVTFLCWTPPLRLDA